MDDKSKAIGKNDDSAGAFLMRTLAGDAGRNFDIDSILYAEGEDGVPHWIIFEFLKCDSVPPEESHPNRYWKKNKRKFFSLWAVTKAFRDTGCKADLLLVNYSESVENVKVMLVRGVAESRIDTKDTYWSFEQWQTWFRKFNSSKKGDTWDYLNRDTNNVKQEGE